MADDEQEQQEQFSTRLEELKTCWQFCRSCWRKTHEFWRKWRVRFYLLMHILGALSSIQAIMSTRTPQGAIAWAISLNTVPTVAVPAFWIFGRSEYDGYELLRHSEMLSDSEMNDELFRTLKKKDLLFQPATDQERAQTKLFQNLAAMPVTRFNDIDLLIDGEMTFNAIFDGIAKAENYVLVEFYIMRPDDLGNRLKDALIAKAKEGVRVYLMFDGLGSRELMNSDDYLQELHDAGVETAAFRTTRGWGNRTRVNFRNHRKIVVVDGKEAFVGGHNVGDEYLGRHETLTPWRDTHIAARGPVVLEAQATFAEDWRYLKGDIPELNWEPDKAPQGDMLSICLPTGPADPLETGTLMLLHLINSATKRIWIASPYFVPDEQFVSALQLAALRGVDVRVIIPENNDDWLVDLTSYSYLEELCEVGIKIYRYQPGFMHQKVYLIDDGSAAIGTSNFDNRSMRLNFEVMLLVYDPGFGAEVKAMLQEDMDRCELTSEKAYTESSAVFRFFVRTARLLAPVQ